MKYSVRQIESKNNQWAVVSGSRYWGDTLTNDYEAAISMAAIKSARWHVEKARECIENMNLNDARSIGHFLDLVIDDVTAKASIEDPDHDENDPRAWLS